MKRPRVLIADDDPAIRALLEDLLRVDGFDVTGVADGEKALEALDLQTPDVVLLDVMMPGRSGFEVLRQIRAREDTKRTPVVMISAKRDEVSVWEGLSNGCDQYVTKPFDPTEVSSIVRRMLAGA